MNAASHVPSGVFTSTSLSTTSIAALAETAVAATPAATDMAMKSRRDTSPVSSLDSSDLRSFSVILAPRSPLNLLGLRRLSRLLAIVTFAVNRRHSRPHGPQVGRQLPAMMNHVP